MSKAKKGQLRKRLKNKLRISTFYPDKEELIIDVKCNKTKTIRKCKVLKMGEIEDFIVNLHISSTKAHVSKDQMLS